MVEVKERVGVKVMVGSKVGVKEMVGSKVEVKEMVGPMVEAKLTVEVKEKMKAKKHHIQRAQHLQEVSRQSDWSSPEGQQLCP